jgi:hypothetical protein
MRDELTQVLRHASWAGGDGPLSRYMQSTFAGRIKARQHLLRELAATRSPRSDTVERIQQIHDPSSQDVVVPPVAATAVGAHGAVARKTAADGSGGTPIVGEAVTSTEDMVVIEASEPPRRRRVARGVLAALLVAGGAAGAVIALGGGSPSGSVGATAAAAPAPHAHARVPAAVPIPIPIPIATPGSAAPPAPVVIPPPPPLPGPPAAPDKDAHHHHHDHDHERVATAPVPTPPPDPTAVPTAETAKSLYKQGLQDFVGGNSAQAIDRFHQALAKDPSYAPAYRGMGMAYERMGDRPHAAAAYRKYLDLDPGAGDAAQIKTRLEGLQ